MAQICYKLQSLTEFERGKGVNDQIKEAPKRRGVWVLPFVAGAVLAGAGTWLVVSATWIKERTAIIEDTSAQLLAQKEQIGSLTKDVTERDALIAKLRGYCGPPCTGVE